MIAEIPPSATRAPFGRKPWSPSIPISPAKSCWSLVAHPASGKRSCAASRARDRPSSSALHDNGVIRPFDIGARKLLRQLRHRDLSSRWRHADPTPASSTRDRRQPRRGHRHVHATRTVHLSKTRQYISSRRSRSCALTVLARDDGRSTSIIDMPRPLMLVLLGISCSPSAHIVHMPTSD